MIKGANQPSFVHAKHLFSFLNSIVICFLYGLGSIIQGTSSFFLGILSLLLHFIPTDINILFDLVFCLLCPVLDLSSSFFSSVHI